jgi:hypothetical protein
MNSDNLTHASLLLEYNVPWNEPFTRVVKYLLSDKITVKTWPEQEDLAVLRAKGYILGIITHIRSDLSQDNVLYVRFYPIKLTNA